MRTSEEIYHRVRWDARFDPARFVLGVSLRGAPAIRVSLPRFVPGGDIPWHRVVFIEADGEVVWDRSAGVDRLDASAAGRVRNPRRLLAPFFTARTPYIWHPVTGWGPLADADVSPDAAAVPGRGSGQAAAPLRVLTWNTLWDRYDSERIDTARRRPLLLEALEHSDADVIALQEVERGLLDLLLSASWVRARYTLSSDPVGKDVENSGLLLLSRLPVREAARHRLGQYKAVAAVTVESVAGPVVVATTHLTSDHSVDGAARRHTEMVRLAEGLAGVDCDLVLVGDFNDGGDKPAEVLALRDAWTEVRGSEDRTPTFDPRINPLAAVSSLTGRASRLDRVLIRGNALRVAGAALRGDTPAGPDGLFVSDHFGVAVELAVGDGPAVTGAVDVPYTVPTSGTWNPPQTWSAPGGDADEDTRSSLARQVTRQLGAAFAEGVTHVVGSRRLGCALPEADLDLVVALPGSVDLAQVQARVTAALPEIPRIRQVRGARVPGLRLHLGDLDVDLVVVSTGRLAPAEAVLRRTDLPVADATALSAVSDADAVCAAVAGSHGGFVQLARQVKAWARVRGLDSAPHGGVPGLGWTVLVARTVLAARTAGDQPERDLLRQFFAAWAAWDWRVPIALAQRDAGTALEAGVRREASTSEEPPAVTVLTPTAPVRSCTTQVDAGWRDLLTQELYQAWEVVDAAATAGGNPVPALLAPPPLHRRHAAWAVLTVRALHGEEFDSTLGRVRGRLRALLTLLARAGIGDVHAWPRPYEVSPQKLRYAIGLGRTPPDAARLAMITENWTRGLPGVDLSWADGGAVPTLR